MKMKKVFLTAVIVGVLSVLNTQAQNNNILIIRVIEMESRMSYDEPRIITVDPTGELRVTELSLRKKKGTTEENTLIIHKEINEWLNKGYKIVHISSSGGGDVQQSERTTIIMSKDEKE